MKRRKGDCGRRERIGWRNEQEEGEKNEEVNGGKQK